MENTATTTDTDERVTTEELDALIWRALNTDPVLKVTATFIARGDDVPDVLADAVLRSRCTFGLLVGTVGLALKFAKL